MCFRDIFVDGTPKDFDYYTLAMQWPGTVCKLEPVSSESLEH